MDIMSSVNVHLLICHLFLLIYNNKTYLSFLSYNVSPVLRVETTE